MNDPDSYETVKKEIRSLLVTFKNGCSLFEFKKQYQMMMSQKLPFAKFGYKSEIEFLYGMPDVVQINPIDKDYYLKVITDQSTKHIQKLVSKQKSDKDNHVIHPNKSAMLQLIPKEKCSHLKQKMDCLDEIDHLEVFQSSDIRNDPIKFFSRKAVSPMNQFTQLRLPTRLVLGSFFSAYVSNILNPGHLYIQLGDEEQALSDMNHALEKFYSDPESKTFEMKTVHMLPGSIGVAQWPVDMHWYRIKVMSLVSNYSVKVYFVDYGTVDIVSKTLLRYMREDFFSFPAQALRASLAYLKPPRGFSTWSQKATDRILELSLDESVKAKVEDIEDDVLSVILYNKNGIYINGALVDEYLSQSTSVDSNHLEPLDIHEIVISKRKDSLFHLPSATLPSPKIRQPSTSINLISQNVHEKPSTCVEFSKPFEVASAKAPVMYPKPQMGETALFLLKTSSPSEEAVMNFDSPSPSNNNEIFDDDADAFFEEFYQKVSLVTKRFVKKIRTGDGYVFHILIYKSKPYVSCGDISHLIWSNKDSEFLLQRLQNSEYLLTNVLIWEDENVNMFNQLRRFNVRGLKVLNDRTSLLIFNLNNLVKILNIFGHPSVELRTKIVHEYSAFNPNHRVWQELSEVEFSEGEEESLDRTGDDKLNRLPLYEQQIMWQNICIRLQSLQQSGNPENAPYEEQKLHLLHEKVLQRMTEIQLICSNFSDA